MRRIVVVGGGISGLAAAWAAQRHAAEVPGGLEVLVLERDGVVGGKARSLSRDEWLVEGGPSGFLGGRPEMERMIESCGLGDERLPAEPAAARRFLWRGGRMRPVAANPVTFARSGILSPRGLLRLLGEPLVPARRDGADESVWAFAARRCGAEVADRLVLPMTLGIYAGDARRLSVQAAFPRMTALERNHGSLVRGLIPRRGRAGAAALTSFRGGMQSLPRALALRGGFSVRCRAEVRGLTRTDTGWHVAVGGDAEPIPADAVVLAGEPWGIAPLLRPLNAEAAADLDAIQCPPVVVVALGYGPAERARVPSGFGVLIPRGEGLRMLGNLWESHLYQRRSPEGHLLIRAMYGGQVDPDVADLTEERLVALARAEMARLYGITTPPVFQETVRVPRAIPQYEMGHLDRVVRIERAVGALPGLFITGFGLRAIAFADAATNGALVGSNAAGWLIGTAGTLAGTYPRFGCHPRETAIDRVDRR